MENQAGETTVVIRFNHMSKDDEVQTHLQQRIHHLANEFPETAHYELSLSPNAGDIRADVYVSGRGTHIAAHASQPDFRQAGEQLLNKLQRELRRHHDKRIFSQRRGAQQDPAKRHI